MHEFKIAMRDIIIDIYNNDITLLALITLVEPLFDPSSTPTLPEVPETRGPAVVCEQASLHSGLSHSAATREDRLVIRVI